MKNSHKQQNQFNNLHNNDQEILKTREMTYHIPTRQCCIHSNETCRWKVVKFTAEKITKMLKDLIPVHHASYKAPTAFC